VRARSDAGRGAVALYEDEGPKIFDRGVFQRIRSAEGLLDENYDAGALDRALERLLSDKRLSRSVPDLIVPAYDMSVPGPYFFQDPQGAPEPRRGRLSAVGRGSATSAAPTYFEPLEVRNSALWMAAYSRSTPR
jgi:patatin-like phospholipase/acyl hydrolase